MGDVVTLEQGLAINKKSKHLLVDKGYPLLRITDMINQKFAQFIDIEAIPEKFIAKDDDLIFSRTGQVGLIFRNQIGVIHNNCFRITPSKKLDRGFLYWFLKQGNIKAYINTLAGGAAQPDLNHDAFKSVPISFPNCIDEQKKIANIFDEYDSLINNNNCRIAILEEMAQSLYREWFVNFRYPNHADALNENGKQNIIDSPLGPIPEGWEVSQLNSVSTMKYGKMSKKELRCDEGIPIYSGYKITGYYPEANFEESKVIVVARGVGGTGDVKMSPDQCWLTNLSIAIIEDEKLLKKSYLFYQLKFANLRSLDSGTSISQITIANLSLWNIVLPPVEIQSKFETYCLTLWAQIRVLKKKNENLKKQLDMLLPKLISGQIELED
jgi:type I restriction enzyme S subunit